MTTAADCFTLTECNCTKVRYAGDFSISNLCDLHQYPDHNPLHFHIRMNDGREALVEIETMEIHSYGISQRDIKEALNWGCKKQQGDARYEVQGVQPMKIQFLKLKQ